MKIRDLIAKMSGNTAVLIYEEDVTCEMPQYGPCRGGEEDEYDCMDCSFYVADKREWVKYYGTAGGCPIKLGELTVKGINNAAHKITPEGKRRQVEVHVIAIQI